MAILDYTVILRYIYRDIAKNPSNGVDLFVDNLQNLRKFFYDRLHLQIIATFFVWSKKGGFTGQTSLTFRVYVCKFRNIVFDDFDFCIVENCHCPKPNIVSFRCEFCKKFYVTNIFCQAMRRIENSSCTCEKVFVINSFTLDFLFPLFINFYIAVFVGFDLLTTEAKLLFCPSVSYSFSSR